MSERPFLTIERIFEDLRADRVRLDSPVEKPDPWRENPATLADFVQSDQYLIMPEPLTPVQYEAGIAVLGEDPKKIFDLEEGTGRTTAVLLWGKGAGKDYLTSILQLYVVHVVLCLEEPQLYFGQAPGEPLDVINVAYNADQARDVYFTKFLARLKRCDWFRKRFDLMQSGRLLEKRKSNSWGEVQIGSTTVVFPGNVRAISESSENEAYEGYNIIFWTMDEASAFKSVKKMENARSIYNTLRTSANTRFVGRWKGFVLSFPRAEDDWDFTTQLYEEALRNPDTMFGSKKFSWEVAPKTTYPGGFFRFTHKREDQTIEIDIPETLRKDFESDPEESLGKYCCMPGRTQGAFIEDTAAIPRVLSDRPPVFEVEPIVIENRDEKGEVLFHGIGYEIVKWNITRVEAKFNYVVHVDCSQKVDRTALVLAHGEPTLVEVTNQETGGTERFWTQRVVEDAHVVWEPDLKRNLRVSIRNVESIILQINEVAHITIVSYDRWNSAGSIETLAMHGITCQEHDVNREDYDLLRGVIYSGDIDLIRDSLTEYELVQLRKTEGGRVDHPLGGSKDLSDALAGATRLILKDDQAIRRKVRSQNVGMPRATVAYNPQASTDFVVGSQSRIAGVSGISVGLGRRGGISLPEIPPMPFGIGSQDRQRPRTRALPSGRSYTYGLPRDPLANRIRELLKG